MKEIDDFINQYNSYLELKKKDFEDVKLYARRSYHLDLV